MICPTCKCTAFINFGKDRKGRQRYKCKNCGRTRGNYSPKLQLQNKIECPFCGNINIIKYGIDYYKNKKIQRYKCLSCNRTFRNISDRKDKVIRNKVADWQKIAIHKYGFRKNKSIKFLQDYTNLPKSTIYKYLKYYKGLINNP